MHVQLGPRPDFEEFLQRAGAARQRDESVGLLDHHGLALAHILHQMQFGQAQVRLFLLLQHLGNHADHSAAAGQHFIGDDAHDADDRSAIHQAQVPFDQFAGQNAGLLDVVRAGAGVRAAIHANVLQSHKRSEIACPVTDCVTGISGSR